jgi:hypothetical protein
MPVDCRWLSVYSKGAIMPEGCARDEWKVARNEERSCMYLAGIHYLPRHSSLFPRPSRSVVLLRPDFLHSVEFAGKLIETVCFDSFANFSHQILIIVQIVNRVQSGPQNFTAFVQVA